MSYSLIGKGLVAVALLAAGAVLGGSTAPRRFVLLEHDASGRRVLVPDSEPRKGAVYVGFVEKAVPPVSNPPAATDGGSGGTPTNPPKWTPHVVCDPGGECNPTDMVKLPGGVQVQLGIGINEGRVLMTLEQ